MGFWLKRFLLHQLSITILSAGLLATPTKIHQTGQKDLSKSISFDFPIIKDIDGYPIDFSFPKKNATLVFFCNPQNILHREIASYINLLYRRYRNRGFDAVGFSNQDLSATRELRAYNDFSYRLVSDEKSEYPKYFQVKTCCGGAVLIGKNSNILFKTSSLPSMENLRQLIEKEILGKITYEFPPIPSHIKTLGNRVLDLPLLDISTSQLTSLAQISRNPLVATFISSYCSICDSGKRIDLLKRVSKQFISTGSNVDFIVIFSKPYSERDLLEMENRGEIPFRKFISYEDAFSETEKYITDGDKKLDPVTIIVHKDRSIEIINTLGIEEAKIVEKLFALINSAPERRFNRQK